MPDESIPKTKWGQPKTFSGYFYGGEGGKHSLFSVHGENLFLETSEICEGEKGDKVKIRPGKFGKIEDKIKKNYGREGLQLWNIMGVFLASWFLESVGCLQRQLGALRIGERSSFQFEKWRVPFVKIKIDWFIKFSQILQF